MNASTATADEPIAAVASTPDQPVATSERLVTLDFIRGIAVLGILFANITAFGQPYMAYFWPQALVEPATAGDKAVWLFQLVFIDHKFRGLFSLLFGAGIYLFMERAWARGRSRWLQFRRLSWLLVFGLIHYYLIWRGDILTVYAFCGMLALPMLRWPAKRQLMTGLVAYALGLLAITALMGSQYAASHVPQVQARLSDEQRQRMSAAPERSLEEARKEIVLYREGSYGEIVAKTAREDTDDLIQELVFVPLTETIALLLIGMGLFRMGFFSGAIEPDRMRRWGWTGVVAGILLSIPIAFWPYLTGFDFFTTLFAFNALGRLTQLPIALGLAALFVLWAPKAAKTALGSRFVAAGRMAFSNYLGTSLIMMVVFHGWALGLFGVFNRVELFAVVVLTWTAMLAWSKPWLTRFRYGPLEWLWRCLTYWKLFPLRR
jgi:uncharacterized protein